MSLSPPPPSTSDLCFSPVAFVSDTYSVDEFVSECRRHVTVEHLHQDLKSYYHTLKTAMIELINKDYSDFLDLSSNLVGMDKEIERLTVPLSQLHQEIMNIKSSMDSVIKELEFKMSARSKLQEKKLALTRLMTVIDCVELLESLLINTSKSLNNKLLDRIAMEYNKLQYNASFILDIPAVQELHPRIGRITDQLQSVLEELFLQSLSSRDHELLIHTLEVYSLISRHSVAENLFRVTFIKPSLEKVISSKAVLTHPQGLDGVFADVMGVVRRECQFLREVCDGVQDREGSGHGFDFIVNSVWPEVVSLCETKASIMFAPGNPDTFHKNYVSSMEFVDQFEYQCHSLSEIKRLRSHSSYSQFMNKWSLPVYFQIRFQEISSKLESVLELPLEEGKDPEGCYSLQVFVILRQCLNSCWSDGVYLTSLVHKFWKLTLQLVIRLGVWLNELLDTQKSLTVTDCVRLVSDIESFTYQCKGFAETGNMKGKLDEVPCDAQSLTRYFLDACDTSLLTLLERFGDAVITKVTQQCAENLDSVQTIPRLFRRTNREVPSKPSGYIGTVLKPLTAIDLTAGRGQEWGKRIIEHVTEKYHEMTLELLSNVKRTEDSLMKLKRSRRSLIPEASSGMSDDNKIRLQLAIDIEAYITQIHNILPTLDRSVINKLEETGRLARAASSTTPTPVVE